MKICRLIEYFIVIILLIFNGFSGVLYGNNTDASNNKTISVTISVASYTTEDTKNGLDISVKDFGSLLIPGKPKLPSRIFPIAIPPGAELIDVNYLTGDGIQISGFQNIAPAQLPRVIDLEDPNIYENDKREYDENYALVYGSDDPYPAEVAEFVRTAGYRKYNLVDVRVTPFEYHPLSGQLIYFPEVIIEVTYSLPENTTTQNTIYDGSYRTEQIAEDLIVNYNQAAGWYPGASRNKGTHDFVIITIDLLTSSVTPLVNWETSKGRTVEVVTTSWINLSYNGYDLAEKMRNFLRDKYPSEEWGIEDVLIVGDYDDVPMRRTAQDLGYGEPETDFYYAELSLPDSLSWDINENHQYGEDSDQIDFYSEINVGRIPWSIPATVESICEKSVSFEQNSDPTYKRNMLLLGGYFWADTDNAELMEYKVDAGLHPWMSDWTITKLYEKNVDYWSTFICDYPLLKSNVMSVWPTGQYSFVNWAGHGSPTSSHIYGVGAPAFISSSDCSALNDDYPAIIFADACSNSDTDNPNIGRAMLQQGAVGFVGATKVALGCPGWNDPNDGSSQSLDYFFTTYVTSGDYSQGAALQKALREMYLRGLWSALKYETFEWGALWGNPNLRMELPALELLLADGTPDYIAPGTATTITLQIREGIDSYVSESGMLHYRFNGGAYLTSALVALGSGLYEATLPATYCNDEPEYYFSIEGEMSGLLNNPFNAPITVYSSMIGSEAIIWQDSFETDQGWTVANIGASDGDWQRGVPVNDPGSDYDPSFDGDGSGQCFLTKNVVGASDVDDGAVRLISPIFDMLENKAVEYQYYLFLTNITGGVDMLRVEVNNNSGFGEWTEISRHDNHGPDWRQHKITEVDFALAGVTLTSSMRFRFTVNDADPQSIVEAGVDCFTTSRLECNEPHLCGDADGTDVVDISDAVFIISYVFNGGQEPNPLAAGDADCSEAIDISDAVYLIAYVFNGGPAPCEACL